MALIRVWDIEIQSDAWLNSDHILEMSRIDHADPPYTLVYMDYKDPVHVWEPGEDQTWDDEPDAQYHVQESPELIAEMARA